MNAHKNVATGDTHEPAPTESGRAKRIENDRDLLDALQMGDPEAAMFLGKSRQALNTQLGSKKSGMGKAPRDYFKLSDILILVSAARQIGREFNVQAVRDYVKVSRPPDELTQKPYDLLMGILDEELIELDTTGAKTMVLILPTLNDLLANRPEVARSLRETVRQAAERQPPVQIFLLASTVIRARSAGQWFAIPEDHCFGRDLVDHYLPSVILYRDPPDGPKYANMGEEGEGNRGQARPYILTEKGGFVASPSFSAELIAECVRSMMPLEMRSALQPPRKTPANQEQAAGTEAVGI
jgi:hypothetical protein